MMAVKEFCRLLLLLAVIGSSIVGNSVNACQRGQPSSISSYSTTDGNILQGHVYLVQFDMKCVDETDEYYSGSLYAQIDDENQVKPIVSLGSNRYQVSWTSGLVSPAKTYQVRLFSEQGLSLVRKALREGSHVSRVPEFSRVFLDHPGGQNGVWLQSEVVAIFCAFVLFIHAFQSRASIMS